MRATSSPARPKLAARQIELVQTERGGEVNYHGPASMTAYIAIVRLADRGLYIRSFARALEAALLPPETCSAFGCPTAWRFGAGCAGGIAQVGAVGVRVERGRERTTASPSTSRSGWPTST